MVKNGVVKKTEYDKIASEVNGIDTTNFVLKTTYDTDKSDLAKKTGFNVKITELEGKIPSISGLVKKDRLQYKNQ